MAYKGLAAEEVEETYTVMYPTYETIERTATTSSGEEPQGAEERTFVHVVELEKCTPEERTRTITRFAPELRTAFFNLTRKDSLPPRCYVRIVSSGDEDAPAPPADEPTPVPPEAPEPDTVPPAPMADPNA